MASVRPPLPHYDSAADLIRAVTHANRVDATHIRLLLLHTAEPLDALERFLGGKVLTRTLDLDTAKERWTVEALACQLGGIGFHALTFSLGPKPGRQVPHSSILEGQEPKSESIVRKRTRSQVFDTIRRPTSLFRGLTRDEYLIQFPGNDHQPQGDSAPQQLLAAALQVTDLALELGRPIEFMHAPAVAPSTPNTTQDLQRTCLRFELAFPRFDDSGRLDFGAKLVDRCCDPNNLYGLSQRATFPGSTEGYWDEVVPLEDDGQDPEPEEESSGRHLAVTCIGPERLGTLHALLRILAAGHAPLLGVSSLTLDGIDIIHVLTRTPRGSVAGSRERRADLALNWALDTRRDHWVVDDRLRDYRLMASTWDEKEVDPARATLWLAWQVPASRDALRLTIRTLKLALEDAWTRHVANGRLSKRYLGIDYLACRTSTLDRLEGRMRISVDLSAFGQLDHDIGPLPDEEGGVSSARQLGQFCRDVRHQWRQSLSLALDTPYIEAQVVWHESWLRLLTPR